MIPANAQPHIVDSRSPYPERIYSITPPVFGIAAANSATVRPAAIVIIPANAQTIIANPGLFVIEKTFGAK